MGLMDMLFGGGQSLVGGGAFADAGALTGNMVTNAMADPTAMNGLYNQFGSTAMGDVIGGLDPSLQMQIGQMGTVNPNMFSGAGSNVPMMQPNSSQGLFGALTSKPATNAMALGFMGNNAYNQHKLTNASIDTMKSNNQRADEAWGREKSRQDRTSALNF